MSKLRSRQTSVLLLGPRQTGKSTLLRSLAPDRVINLASPATFRDYVSEPERLERELSAAPAGVRSVLIDEVQKVPALLDACQVFLDEHPRRFRFLLSGSSARKLRRGQANLLPGRLLSFSMHPLLERELGESFDLDRVLAHGSLPGIYAEPDDQERTEMLRSYADTYLREEIQAEAVVRDLGGYARLLDLVATSSGRILNVSALAQNARISYETTRRYVEILEDTLLVVRIPAFSGSDRATLIAHPKLFLFDIGVRNALLRRPLDRCLPDERGILLEHLVGSELWRRLGALWPELQLFHYRTPHGAEVDFVARTGRETWGIEVKASRRVGTGDLRGLASLAERTRLARKIVVFLGAHAQRIDDVEILPLRDFLKLLPP